MNRLNILINAYSVSPKHGSELGMGWNWIIHLANYCSLYIISESEWKEEIEQAIATLPQNSNLHFYYIDQNPKAIRMGKNQGDWRFYWYYNQWQKKAFHLAQEIVKKQHIDLIHHLNIIGYREPGYLWKISGIPYVWGPIGGMELTPTAYLKGAGFQKHCFTYTKNLINWLQSRYNLRVRKAFCHADILIAATSRIQHSIQKIYHKPCYQLNEIGCHMTRPLSEKSSYHPFRILWVGRFFFTKQLQIALHAMNLLKGYSDIELHVCGSGSEQETVLYRQMAKNMGLQSSIVWHGQLSLEEVRNIREQSDLFLFTSIMEGTSTVLLEAVESGLPILCFDTCGMADVVNEKIGIKIPLSSPERSARDFAQAILTLYNDPARLQSMSNACIEEAQKRSWTSYAATMFQWYQEAILNHQKAYEK